jgi:hypothetical protein
MRRRPAFHVLQPQPQTSLPQPKQYGRLLLLIPATLVAATIFFFGLIHIAAWLEVPQRIAAVLEVI